MEANDANAADFQDEDTTDLDILEPRLMEAMRLISTRIKEIFKKSIATMKVVLDIKSMTEKMSI